MRVTGLGCKSLCNKSIYIVLYTSFSRSQRLPEFAYCSHGNGWSTRQTKNSHIAPFLFLHTRLLTHREASVFPETDFVRQVPVCLTSRWIRILTPFSRSIFEEADIIVHWVPPPVCCSRIVHRVTMPSVRYNVIWIVAKVSFGFALNNASRSLCLIWM